MVILSLFSVEYDLSKVFKIKVKLLNGKLSKAIILNGDSKFYEICEEIEYILGPPFADRRNRMLMISCDIC